MFLLDEEKNNQQARNVTKSIIKTHQLLKYGCYDNLKRKQWKIDCPFIDIFWCLMDNVEDFVVTNLKRYFLFCYVKVY